MARGFVKILEALIASIIILSSVSYFINIREGKSMWNEKITQIEAYDALAVLDKTGALQKAIWSNNVSLTASDGLIKKMFRPMTDFSLEVDGLPKPIIYVGCLCNNEETERLRNMLLPGSSPKIDYFLLDGRPIQIRINTTDLSDLENIDLLFSFSKSEYENNKDQIEQFLRNDGGVVLLDNITEADLSYLNNIGFGLNWSSSLSQEKNSFWSQSPDKLSYRISKYFSKVPFRVNTNFGVGTFYIGGNSYDIETHINATTEWVEFPAGSDINYTEGELFNIGDWTIEVTRINANITDEGYNSVDLTIKDRNFNFSIPVAADANQITKDNKTILYNINSAVKVNYDVYKGGGRTAWVSWYPANYSDMNQLLKSIILWTSGEKFVFYSPSFKKTEYKTKPKTYNKVTRLIIEKQPYEVNLYIWNVFF